MNERLFIKFSTKLSGVLISAKIILSLVKIILSFSSTLLPILVFIYLWHTPVVTLKYLWHKLHITVAATIHTCTNYNTRGRYFSYLWKTYLQYWIWNILVLLKTWEVFMGMKMKVSRDVLGSLRVGISRVSSSWVWQIVLFYRLFFVTKHPECK